MARPTLAPGARTLQQLQPPPFLTAAERKQWAREFDRFPAGYYTPADVNAMVLYLETVADYRDAKAREKAAKSTAAQRVARVEVSGLRRLILQLQRALRMLPNTRAHSDVARNAANDPSRQQVGNGNDDAEPMWKRVMDTQPQPKPKRAKPSKK